MLKGKRIAKINLKVLVILIIIATAIVVSLFAANRLRRSYFSKHDLDAGLKAYENKDWVNACKYLQEYIGRNQNDIDIIRKYAEAKFAIRPITGQTIAGAAAAYRLVIQLDPADKAAYDKLAMLYSGMGDWENLSYIAKKKLETSPEDKNASLWLADAQINQIKIDDANQTLSALIKRIEALSGKHPEYIKACQKMSTVVMKKGDYSPESAAKSLQWLSKAVSYAPDSNEALVNRAQFYSVTSAILGMSSNDRLSAARKDLDAADALGMENPSIIFVAGSLWLALGEPDKVVAEIKRFDKLSQETIEKYFIDVKGAAQARYLLASELAMKRGEISQAVSLTDAAMKDLPEERNRVQILPSVIRIYAVAGNVDQAKTYLKEYIDNLNKTGETPQSKTQSDYLQALVAMAEGKPYAAIEILQPAVVSNSTIADIWRLLAQAYSQTSQSRRAIFALNRYLSLYQYDGQMAQLLAQEYSKQQDWDNMLKAAKQAESIDPNSVAAKLLRIEADINLTAGQADQNSPGKFEKLAAELQQLRNAEPNDINVRLLQALAAKNLNQPDIVERELKSAIQQCRSPMLARMRLVEFYQQNNRNADAMVICEEACKSDTNAPEPWLKLSELYVAQKDYEMARSTLRKGLDTITAKQQKRFLSVRLALLEIANGDRKTGIKILTEVAAADPQEIQARLLLLNLAEIISDPDKSGRLIEQLKQAEGQSGLWWRLNQAALWLNSAQWRDRQRDITVLLNYCISTDPQWTAPVLALMDLYQRLGDAKNIEDTAKQAIARNASAVDVADRLLLLIESQKRYDEARTILEQVKASWNTKNAWKVNLALRTGDVPEAINQMKLRVASDKKDSNSRIQLARLIYQQTKDPNQAFVWLNEAEAITGDSITITSIKAAIFKSTGQSEEALKVINDYVADHNNFNACLMRATYLTSDGQYELAEADFKKLTTFTNSGANGYELLSRFYLSRDKSAQAVATLDEGIKKYPEELTLQRTLMKLLYVSGPAQDRPKALEMLVQLEKKLPDDTEIMLIRARQLLEDAKPESLTAAKELLEKVVKLAPTTVEAHLALIGIAIQTGQYNNARDYAIAALAVNQDNPTLLAARGQAELATGNTQMAANLAQLALVKDPNNVTACDVLTKAAIVSMDGSLLKEARTQLESAVDKNPADEKFLISLAQVLASMKQPGDAIAKLRAYCQTEQGSKSVSALITLAEMERQAGDLDKAQQTIAKAEALAPNNQSVIHARFLLLVSQKNYNALENISEKYLSAESQNPDILIQAGTILVGMEKMTLRKEGLKLYEKLVSLTPKSINARIGLASAAFQIGDAARAEQLYRQLLADYPEEIRIINDLAWIIQDQNNPGKYDEALELANKGLKMAPSEVHLLDTRGTILSKMPNRLADAAKDFEKLAELSADQRQKAKVLLKLGRTYVKLGNKASAKKQLEAALEIDSKINIFTAAEKTEIAEILK